jgi:hypothetical protein
MTGISLQMQWQWPMTYHSHCSVSQSKQDNWFFVTDQTPCPQQDILKQDKCLH